MAGEHKYPPCRSVKIADTMMTPPRKLRQLVSPPKINQTRPLLDPARVGPLIPSLDDWIDKKSDSLECPSVCEAVVSVSMKWEDIPGKRSKDKEREGKEQYYTCKRI